MQSSLPSPSWRRPLWLALLVCASVAFTFGFACAVPLAAIGAACALTLPRRDAIIVALGAWLANQVTGFAFLGYPLNLPTFAWGAALGVMAVLCVFAAAWASARLGGRPAILRMPLAFIAAFAAYEAALAVFSLLLGGMENVTLAEQSRFFAINAVALALLFALARAGAMLRLAPAAEPLTQGHA